MSIAQPAEWQGRPVHARRHRAGCSARARIRCTSSWSSTGGRRSRRPTSSCSSWTAGRGCVPGDEEIAGSAARSANVPVLLAVNKTDDKRARGRALEFYQLGFEPVVEIAAEHGQGVGRPARRGRSSGCRRSRTPARPKPTPARSRGRDRRPAERRQVVAGQSVAAEERMIVSEMPGRRATPSTRVLQLAPPDVPDRRHGRHPAAGPGRARRASSKSSACSLRGGRSSRRTWPCS